MRIKIVFGLLIFSLNLSAQVYKKNIIYKFEYNIEKGDSVTKGVLYLGCLGKEFKTSSEPQYAVTWTRDADFLKRRIRSTGIIEDKTRVWLHPPRMDRFSIIEYSPFPQIHYPLQVGNKWNWTLTPGSNWVSEELGITEDITLRYQFIIKDKINVFLSALHSSQSCFLVIGESIDNNGYSCFEGYYSSELGFVKMIFSNRDGSIITFNLNDIIEWSELSNDSATQFKIPFL